MSSARCRARLDAPEIGADHAGATTMNYLAHAFLARSTPELLTGGVLGDFVKGPLDQRYAAAVRHGIALHRALDDYTDRHPQVQQSRALISPARRRFAGILVDVFYDHFLARDWLRFTDEPLTDFTARVYATLWPQRAGFPERLQRMLPWMRADDWLASYAEIGAVDTALHGIARRFRYPDRAAPLRDAVEELRLHYRDLDARFQAFFPDAQRFAAGAAASASAAA
jgi:acyl carrier protein phosphodiesterase